MERNLDLCQETLSSTDAVQIDLNSSLVHPLQTPRRITKTEVFKNLEFVNILIWVHLYIYEIMILINTKQG